MADQAEEVNSIDTGETNPINLPEIRIGRTLDLLMNLRGQALQRIRDLENTSQEKYGVGLSPTDDTKGLRGGLDSLVQRLNGAIDGVTLAINMQEGFAAEPEWLTNARTDFGLPAQKQLIPQLPEKTSPLTCLQTPINVK